MSNGMFSIISKIERNSMHEMMHCENLIIIFHWITFVYVITGWLLGCPYGKLHELPGNWILYSGSIIKSI
jgi:hypothetical protein